jgi:putative flippase GtrA
VNVAELHRFAVYGSTAPLVYPGTFACCTHPHPNAAIANRNAIDPMR